MRNASVTEIECNASLPPDKKSAVQIPLTLKIQVCQDL